MSLRNGKYNGTVSVNLKYLFLLNMVTICEDSLIFKSSKCAIFFVCWCLLFYLLPETLLTMTLNYFICWTLFIQKYWPYFMSQETKESQPWRPLHEIWTDFLCSCLWVIYGKWAFLKLDSTLIFLESSNPQKGFSPMRAMFKICRPPLP